MQSKLNIIKIHHREWAVPHLALECPIFTAAVVQCWEWALAELTLVLYKKICTGIALKCVRRMTWSISKFCSTSAKKTRSITVSSTWALFRHPKQIPVMQNSAFNIEVFIWCDQRDCHYITRAVKTKEFDYERKCGTRNAVIRMTNGASWQCDV